MWGVTYIINWIISYRRVSIHTPVWGVTGSVVVDIVTLLFQSTRPCGA